MNIDFPFRIGADGRTAFTPSDKHVREMIELLLFTTPGERVMQPDFGTGLLQYAFGPNSPEVAAALQLTIQSALSRWLGDIVELRSVTVDSDDAALRTTVVYALRATGDQRSETFVRAVT